MRSDLPSEPFRVASENSDDAKTAQNLRDRHHILAAYERLRARPDDWASYVGELAEWAEVGAESVRRSGE